jgi:hypothetical protein
MTCRELIQGIMCVDGGAGGSQEQMASLPKASGKASACVLLQLQTSRIFYVSTLPIWSSSFQASLVFLAFWNSLFFVPFQGQYIPRAVKRLGWEVAPSIFFCLFQLLFCFHDVYIITPYALCLPLTAHKF